MSVFVDTSAWYSLWDAQETNHKQAQAILSHLKSKEELLITNELVISETFALLANRIGWQASRQAAQAITDNKSVSIMILTPEQWQETCLRYIHGSGRLSFVDCSAFVTMESRKIKKAFAFDEDFNKAGFELIKPG
ncbi:MAG: PIN domain-containing protein [Elusimicrobiota bacterium]